MGLISLIKIYILNSLGINKALHENDTSKKKKSIAYICIICFLGIMIINSSIGYSYLLSEYLKDIDLLPSIMAFASTVIIFISTIVLTKSVLIRFSDYETQMTLPINTKVIVISRFLILYLYSMVITILLTVPANIIYGIKTNAGAMFYIVAFVLMFVISIIPIALGIILGLSMQYFISKFKNGNIIAFLILLLLVLSAGYMIIEKTGVTNIANNLESIIKSVINIFPVMILYRKAICSLNLLSAMLFIIISIVVFVTLNIYLSNNFKKLNTYFATNIVNKSYVDNDFSESNILISLIKKNMKRYFSSTVYVSNTIPGIFMALVGSLVLVILGEDKISLLIGKDSIVNLIKELSPFIIASLMSFTTISSSLISLEGKNFWILKSLPINPLEIFKGMVIANLIITVPVSLIASILVSITLSVDGLALVFTIIIPVLHCFITSILGVVINLKFPLLDWESETVVIKQSMSPMVTLLVGEVILALPMMLIMMNRDLIYIVMCIYSLLLIFINSFMVIFLRKKGVGMFNKLQ